MKYLNIYFLALFFLISCSDDIGGDAENNGDNENPYQCDSKFCGEWQVIKIHRGFSMPENFNEGDIIWNFFSNDSVEIFVNIELINYTDHPFLKDTSVEYSFESYKIMIGDFSYDYYLNEEDSVLKLADGYAYDGPLIDFVKK